MTSTTSSRRFSRRTTIAAGVAALAVVGVGGFQYANAADPGVDIVYVATGADFPDALAGGVLAALDGAPIILLNKDSIPGASSIELDRLNPRYIRILGGTGVVSNTVATQLKAYATANTADEVTRIAGANRFATAAEISKRVPAAASKLPDNQVKQVTGNPAMPAALGVLASTAVTLPDVCPGPDRWKVRATANGYYLTGGSVNSGGASVGLSLDDAGTYTSGSVNNQNFNLAVGQTRETYSADWVYDNVDAGNHTVREWGVENTDTTITAASNRLIVQVLGYTC